MTTVDNAQMTFRAPSFYWDDCGSLSLIVSKGENVDLLPGESGSRNIFSGSIFMTSYVAERERNRETTPRWSR